MRGTTLRIRIDHWDVLVELQSRYHAIGFASDWSVVEWWHRMSVSRTCIDLGIGMLYIVNRAAVEERIRALDRKWGTA